MFKREARNSFLLSICVPTYNRANLLEHCLQSISESIIDYEEIIEVIVSDNCSTDNTEQIINYYREKISNFFPYRNDSNIGFNGNLVRIINEYSTGKFCWIIGDDDIIAPYSVREIVKVLLHDDIDFINFNFETINNPDFSKIYNKYNFLPNYEYYHYNNFEDNISLLDNHGNILFSFISASIIRKDILNQIDLNRINADMWKNVETLFPLSYYYAKLLKGKRSLYINFPFVIAIVHIKDWNWGLPLLHLKYLPDLYRHYLKQGFGKSQLRNTKLIIFSCAINSLFRRNKGLKNQLNLKFNFFTTYMFDFDLYFILTKKIAKKFFQWH